MRRYPRITGHVLGVVAAGVGLYGSFCDLPGVLSAAAACAVVSFFLLVSGQQQLQGE